MIKRYRILGYVVGALFALTLCASERGFVLTDEDPAGRFPFTYRALTEEDRQSSLFVPETYYAVIGKESVAKSVVVGPCSPCFLIAAYCKKLDKLLVFHKPVNEGSKDFLTIIKKEFSLQTQKAIDLDLFLFTRLCKRPIVVSNTTITFDHHNKQANRLILDIADEFQWDPTRIKDFLYLSDVADIPDKAGACATVFIDKDLHVFSTSLENTFRKKYPSLGVEEKMILLKNDYKTVFEHYNRLCKGGKVELFFARISDSDEEKVVLEKLEALCCSQKNESSSSSS